MKEYGEDEEGKRLKFAAASKRKQMSKRQSRIGKRKNAHRREHKMNPRTK